MFECYTLWTAARLSRISCFRVRSQLANKILPIHRPSTNQAHAHLFIDTKNTHELKPGGINDIVWLHILVCVEFLNLKRIDKLSLNCLSLNLFLGGA